MASSDAVLVVLLVALHNFTHNGNETTEHANVEDESPLPKSSHRNGIIVWENGVNCNIDSDNRLSDGLSGTTSLSDFPKYAPNSQ